MQGAGVLRKNPNIVTRVIDEETILLPVLRTSSDINCIYTLNKSASRVWALINGKRTLSEIKTKVMEDFDATPKEVETRMGELLGDLKKINALTPASRPKPGIQKKK